MLLSDRDITAAIAEGRLGIEPYDAGLVQPSSIDVRLDRFFRVFNNSRYTHIDPAEQQDDLTTLVEPEGDDPFVLHPGEFVPGLDARGRQHPRRPRRPARGQVSLGRLGLLTHSTAGFVDPGFSGHITLELSNVANLPITLWPGMKIGQLCMFRLTSPAGAPVRLGGLRLPLPGPARADAVPVLPQLHPRGDPSSVADVRADRRLGAGHLQDVRRSGRSTTSPGRTGSPRRRRTAPAS